MGLDDSFNSVFPVAACGQAIEVLAGQPCASDSERLLAALPWKLSSRAYEDERQRSLPREEEFALFGSMWTSFSAGYTLFVMSFLDDDYRPATDAFWREALEKAGVHWQK